MIRRIFVFASSAAVLGVSSLANASSSTPTQAPTPEFVRDPSAPFTDPRISPFSYREHIESVAALKLTKSNGKRTTTRLVGAVVKFRALPGLTTEWLQRLINEHRAMMASMPDSDAVMTDCPLVLSGVSARVTSAGDGFAVSLKSNDKNTAREVLRRAQALVKR